MVPVRRRAGRGAAGLEACPEAEDVGVVTGELACDLRLATNVSSSTKTALPHLWQNDRFGSTRAPQEVHLMTSMRS